MVDSKDFEALGVKAANPTLVDGQPLPYREDPERKAHTFVTLSNKHIWRAGMTDQDVIDRARIDQLPIKALCGQMFVPDVDPRDREACSECYAVAKLIKEGFNYDRDFDGVYDD